MKIAKELKQEQETLLKLLQASELYNSYDDVDVPDDYVSNLYKIEEQKGLQEDGTVIITDAERRKLEERVVCNTFEPRYFPYWQDAGSTYQKSKREPKFEQIKNYEGNLYYGVTEDMPKLQMACHIADNYHRFQQTRDAFYNENFKIVAISVSNIKHFKSHMHIDDFFGKYENNKLIIDDSIIAWNTARKLKPLMDNLEFMSNYEQVNPDVYADYRRLYNYVDSYYVNLDKYRHRDGMKEHFDDLIVFLDKIEKLQEMAESQASNVDISEFVKDQELAPGLESGVAVNREMVDLSEKLMEYAAPVKDLFNQVEILRSGYKRDIETNLMMHLNEIIDYKGLKYEPTPKKVEEVEEELVTNN
jgi:hypothetical protein